MKHNEMIQLIEEAELEIKMAFEHQLRYIFSLWVGDRSQCDMIVFKSREEFENLTVYEAKKMIEESKADMVRASKTKSGNLSDAEEVEQAKKDKRKIAVKSDKKKEDETEKYLRQMRARGQKLAKSVRYG